MNITQQMNDTNIIQEAKAVLDIDITALQSFRESIDQSFVDAANMIYACTGKIIVTGVGKSGIIARKIAATLSSLGTLAIFLHPTDALHGDLGTVESRDVVLAIGKSGESDELLALIPSINKIGARIISIVGNPQSRLAQASDAVIITETEKEACSLNLAPTTSTTLSLVAGDTLAIILTKMKGFEARDYAVFHPAGTLGKRLLLKVSDLMHSAENNPVVHEDILVKEALVTMTAHAKGAVVVIDAAGKLLGIITEGDLRRALQTYDNLLEMNAKDIMTEDPTTISPDVQAFDALKLMENRPSQISVLPVVDDAGIAIGIIRLHDLVNVGL